MPYPTRTLFVSALALAGLLIATRAGAQVVSLSGSVSPDTTVQFGSSTNKLLTWTVRTNTQPGSAVTSAQGQFRVTPAGAVLGTVGVPLSGTVNQAGDVLLLENLTVPSSIIQQAQQLGSSSFVYQRTFTDPTFATGTTQVTFSIQLPSLSVSGSTLGPAAASVTNIATASFAWRVESTLAGQAVRSTQGAFLLPNGQPLGTAGALLSGTTSPAPLSFSETLTVPQSIAIRAQRAGATQVIFRRQFELTNLGVIASDDIPLPLTSGIGGQFAIHRIQLRFEDGNSQRVLRRGQPLTAFADVRFSGTGVLQAQWQVALPSSTAGEPVFQPLLTLREPLIGGREVTLRLPDLPTHAPGLHLIRLRLIDPDGELTIPLLRYFVADGDAAAGMPRMALQLLEPQHLSRLSNDTYFRWHPVPGASVYQLEFYLLESAPAEPRAGPPLLNAGLLGSGQLPIQRLTGVMIPPGQEATVLSILARSHLRSGRPHLWRLLALDATGKVIAESPLREILVP